MGRQCSGSASQEDRQAVDLPCHRLIHKDVRDKHCSKCHLESGSTLQCCVHGIHKDCTHKSLHSIPTSHYCSFICMLGRMRWELMVIRTSGKLSGKGKIPSGRNTQPVTYHSLQCCMFCFAGVTVVSWSCDLVRSNVTEVGVEYPGLATPSCIVGRQVHRYCAGGGCWGCQCRRIQMLREVLLQ